MVFGIKIYEHSGETAEKLCSQWCDIGINTAFVSHTLLADSRFRETVRRFGISLYLITPMLHNFEACAADKSLYGMCASGEQTTVEWLHFVCPTNRGFKDRLIALCRRAVELYAPDGLSIDFARYFVFWEKVYPDTPYSALPNSCFCNRCCNLFEQASGLRLPHGAVDNPPAASFWILNHAAQAFTEWKCKLISTMVEELIGAATTAKRGLKVVLHAIPWRRSDFNGAVYSVAGQDIGQLARFVTYISPMSYSHMVRQPPPWIHAINEEFSTRSSAPILPCIQVERTYLSEEFSVDEFETCCTQALLPPSRGLVLWSWPHLVNDRRRIECVKKAITAAKKGVI
ncbi:MAG: hypothetical protein JW795_00700 [Chitinivibrionales bacterium]|nr:hypothetical protein [Chitinivibrionales bacterium]